MVAKLKEVQKDVKQVLPNISDPELDYIVAWYKADDDNATMAEADKVRQAIKKLPKPESVQVLRQRVEKQLIEACIDGKGSQVVLEHECNNMRRQFGYDEATGMEKAIIDRIILCWLRLQKCERVRAVLDHGTQLMTHLELAEKQLHMAHSRYMKAIEELARVQFLMSRTHPARLAAVRAAMNGEPPPGVLNPAQVQALAKIEREERRRRAAASDSGKVVQIAG